MASFWHDTPAKTTQLPLFDKPTLGAISKAREMGLAGLQNPTAGFAPIKTAAQSNFMKQIPSIAERFSNSGGSGRYGSALAGAQSDFNQQLAALEAQYGQGQQQHFSNLLNTGTKQTFQNQYTPEQQAGWKGLAGQLPAIGATLGAAYLSGGASLGGNALGAAAQGIGTLAGNQLNQYNQQSQNRYNQQQGLQPVQPQQQAPQFPQVQTPILSSLQQMAGNQAQNNYGMNPQQAQAGQGTDYSFGKGSQQATPSQFGTSLSDSALFGGEGTGNNQKTLQQLFAMINQNPQLLQQLGNR